MTQFIATGPQTTMEGKNIDRTVYGVGDTAEEALRDAVEWVDRVVSTAYFFTLEATERLVAKVERGGGDVNWHIVDGVADLRG